MEDANIDATIDSANAVDVNEPIQEKSMEDTIGDTLNDILSRNKKEQEDFKKLDESGVKADVKKEATKERPRDNSGKFAPKTTAEAEVTSTEEPATENSSDVAEEKFVAPNTWKKEAAAALASADPLIKSEVARREADFHKGIAQYKEAATFANTIDQAIAPYRQTINQLGLSPDRAIAELMGADHKLRYGSQQEKQAYFAQLAHNYGIDLGQAANIHSNTDPRLYQQEIENNRLRNELALKKQWEEQQLHNSLNSEIQAFASDPKHSHYEQVKGHMAALLQAEQATSLADAYEQAIYANPVTRAAVLQQQAAEAREEAAKKAQAAKAASSINVKSRPAMPVAQPIGTMEDTIRNTLRRLTT